MEKQRDHLIQFNVSPALYKKLQLGSQLRGTKKVNVLCRMILIELSAKGYFDAPLNQIEVITLGSLSKTIQEIIKKSTKLK